MDSPIIRLALDRVTIRLREDHDFGFLRDLGEVFASFDEQDSGNICFGVDDGCERLLVKYAGARTIAANCEPEDAIARLKAAVPVYEALRHPSLVELCGHFQANDGYAAVFAWVPGECLHPYWAFSSAERRAHPDSPYCRHRHLPLDRRLDSLDAVFAFHEHVSSKGYVAIDFYDGSILYDFERHTTRICDIDHYAEQPYVNRRGRLWGSKRFMSPEEFVLGAAIDEVTNVFNMGATAFVLLGGETDRSFAEWDASEALYEVARKAAHPDRDQRYRSISAFREAWDRARTESQ